MKTPGTYNIKSIILEVLLVAYLIAILYSKTLLTVIIGLLFVMSFMYIENKKTVIFYKKNLLKKRITLFLKSKQYPALTLIFFLVVLSGINSSDLHEWKHHLILKLPFLLLPFAFSSIGEITTKQYFRLYIYFVVIIFLSTFPVLIEYFTNKEEIDNIIKSGQIITTPIDHIRYSLLLAFSVAASFILYESNYYKNSGWFKPLIGTIGIFNFITLHLIAVRSGLIIVYILLLFLIIRCNWSTKKKNVLIILSILFVFPIFSYQFINSFRNKIDYMKYDYDMHLQNQGRHYSDSERYYSVQVGKEIFKDNIILGTGIGDLKSECIQMYKKIYPDKVLDFKYPHNQFLFILTGSGVMGLILFLIAIYYPLFYKKNRKDPFFLSFMILITISFFVENSIERSYSTGIYLFFVLIALNHSLSKSRKNDDNNYLCTNFKNSIEQ